jgi:hypothetical protein
MPLADVTLHDADEHDGLLNTYIGHSHHHHHIRQSPVTQHPASKTPQPLRQLEPRPTLSSLPPFDDFQTDGNGPISSSSCRRALLIGFGNAVIIVVCALVIYYVIRR